MPNGSGLSRRGFPATPVRNTPTNLPNEKAQSVLPIASLAGGEPSTAG
jgi:hypothetical protein